MWNGIIFGIFSEVPICPKYAVKYWEGVLAKMVKTPTWSEMKTRYRWGDTFMIDGLGEFFGHTPGSRHRHCEPTRHGKEEIGRGG